MLKLNYPQVNDVVFIHLRNENIKCHAQVLAVNKERQLPIRVHSEQPFEYFPGMPLHVFSVALNEIVEVDNEGG